MFHFRVLAWNAGYKEGSYSKSINRTLFGGSPGHSAAELVIPVSEENRQLIKEVNKNNKLLVQETTTLITRPIDKEPFYEAVEVPCFKVYFSFWGDVSTKKTTEHHRMLDLTKDRIEEGQGIPQQYSEKGKQILGNQETEWHGLIGKIKGSSGIEYIQHLAGLTEEQIKISKEKMEQLKSIEQEKELLLWQVKEISGHLQKLKTEEQKQSYISSERVQEILAVHEVHSIEELQSKLSGMSAALSTLRKDLSDLGVEFGASPDEIIHFSIDPEHQQEFSLDYKEILKEMGEIANGVVPYHALKMNCCTATMKIINAGISPELRGALQESGYSLPTSNLFFETPQSVFDFSLKLESTLSRANSHIKDTKPGLLARFASSVHQAYVDITSKIFKPSKKQQLFNQRAEYIEHVVNTKEGLKQLEKEFSSGKIEQKSYEQLKANANDLIEFHKNKVIDTEKILLAEGYIERTSDYDSQIKEFLETLPYAQYEAITKLESDTQIIDVIDKISSHIYSNLKGQEIYGDISQKDITKAVASHFEKTVNNHRIALEKFDYESAKNIENSKKLTVNIQQTLNREIQPEKIMVDRDVANLFLESYEKNLESLKRKAQTYERNLQKQKDPASKTAETMQRLLSETQASILVQEEAIEKIKNGHEDRIEIVFPPISKIKDMSLHQMQAYSSLLATKPDTKNAAGDLGAELYKNIRIVNKLQEKIVESTSKIKPDYYDFNTIEQIRSSFTGGPFAKQTSEIILEKLAQNLIEDLDKQALKVPLTTDARNAIISYLNFKKYIETEGSKISNASKLSDILSHQDPEQLKQVLDDHDKVMRFSQRSQRSNQPSLISKHLTHEEHRFIYLYHKIVTSKDECSHQERVELSMMIEKNIGNMDLNKRVGLFEKEKHPLIEKYQLTIPDMKYLMFKTKLFKLNDALLDKSEKALEVMEKGEALDLESQLTLFELGRLDDLAKLKPILDNLDSLGLIESSSKLKKLHEQATHAAEIIGKIEEKIADEPMLESGDLVMNHSKKSLALKNKSADREVALTHTFISKYGHAAQVYIDPETNKPTFSHIWGEHQTDRVKVVDIAISDTFRVDVTRLISPEMQEKLENHYKAKGLDWKEEVRKQFKENAQRLLVESKERFEGVKNDKAARFQAGWANFGLYGGHHDKDAVDRREVHDAMYGKGEYQIKDKMICSEFVAKSVVAAIYETNESLHEQMVKEGVIESSDNIIRIPLERERLERVPPQRLIDLLKKEGCLEQVNQSSFLKKLVNQKQLYDKVELKSVKSPGVIFYEQLLELAHTTPNKQEFISQATEACKTYAEDEHLDIEFENPGMQAYLEKSFSFVHDRIHDNPNCVVKFFRSLANRLGFESEAKEKIKSTVSELEKIQNESILDNYRSKTDKTVERFSSIKERNKSIVLEQEEPLQEQISTTSLPSSI
ncbi:hypothetical protein [Legionella shakespearei]|uniref:Coiled-coil protein n=1 Tax=Legionella shakespearei DSM 23087 TaxID=1122169 RepID=A0A0W0Z7M8_9GAMM|nr:hypothetical protein [Legionella shakespearei]KTD64943.1 coiled-coil protein [Legionella shakespearei DSM 23087]